MPSLVDAMAEKNPDKIEFSAHVNGILNGEPIRVDGAGHIDPSHGLTDGTYEYQVPESFDPMLLSAFLICGYPNAAGRIGEVPNIFAGRGYDYFRTLRLRDGMGEVHQRASIRVQGNRIESKMHLRGTARTPKLVGIEPVVESWEPDGPGGIRGHFAIGWRTDGGSYVMGDATSRYHIATADRQPGVMHRFILMTTLMHDKLPRLREVQTEGLFHTLPMLWVPEGRRAGFGRELAEARVDANRPLPRLEAAVMDVIK